VSVPGSDESRAREFYVDKLVFKVVLGCDHLNRSHQHLVAEAVEVDRDQADQPWGKQAVIRDPDGDRLLRQQG
jgi:hypothetical protein